MGIGSVPPPRTQRRTQSAQVDPRAFGAGVANALGNLAAATQRSEQEVADLQSKRDQAQIKFGAEEQFIRYQGAQARAQEERLRKAQETGDYLGLTNRTEAEITAANNEYLGTVPEEFRDQYRVELENMRQNQISGAFAFEYEQGNEAFRAASEGVLNDLSADLEEGTLAADTAINQFNRVIEASDLPLLERDAIRQAAETRFRSIEFGREVTAARNGSIQVGEATGEDVVAGGLMPHERGFLNAVAAPESGNRYNIRYGGAEGSPQTFDSYDDHPRIYEKRADGRLSSAAGRYQFTATEWDRVAGILGLTDFSPVNQDRAALYLAKERYNEKQPQGLSFDEAMQSGDRATVLGVRDALAGTWEAFESFGDEEFLSLVNGQSGIAGGGTGSAVFPDVWADPRFEGIPYAQRLALASHSAQQADAAFMETQRLVQEQRLGQLRIANSQALNGALGRNDIESLRDRGIIRTASEQRSFEEFADRYTRNTGGVQAVNGQLASTTYQFTSADQKNLNAFVGQQGLQSIASGDAAYMAESFMPLVNRTGIIPSEAGKVLNDLALGGDPVKAGFALESLSNMQAGSPNVLERGGGLSEEARKRAQQYSVLRAYLTPEQSMERLQRLTNPDQAQAARILREAGEDEFKNRGYDIDEITELLDPGVMTRGPSAPATTFQQAALVRDARALYLEGFTLGQGDAVAREYMTKQLQTQWGYSDLGGSRRLIKNGPEKFYNEVEGGYGYIDEIVREDLGLDPDVNFSVIADPQTLAEAASYHQGQRDLNASYLVAVEQEDGNYALQYENVAPVRLSFELTERQKEVISLKAERANLEARIEAERSRAPEFRGRSPEPRAESVAEVERLNKQLDALDSNLNLLEPVDRTRLEQRLSRLESEQSRLREDIQASSSLDKRVLQNQLEDVTKMVEDTRSRLEND